MKRKISLNLGKKIRNKRKELKKSGEELGKYAGLSCDMIYLIERGKRYPNLKHIDKIAGFLKFKKDELKSELIAERMFYEWGNTKCFNTALEILKKELRVNKKRKKKKK